MMFDHVVSELQLMFKLMDRVPDGILPMLKDLEEHIVSAGLADMVASADIITQVGKRKIKCVFVYWNCMCVCVVVVSNWSRLSYQNTCRTKSLNAVRGSVDIEVNIRALRV